MYLPAHATAITSKNLDSYSNWEVIDANTFINWFATIEEIWTNGPYNSLSTYVSMHPNADGYEKNYASSKMIVILFTSFPSGNPLPRTNGNPITFATNVRNDKYSFSTTPLNITVNLNSEQKVNVQHWL